MLIGLTRVVDFSIMEIFFWINYLKLGCKSCKKEIILNKTMFCSLPWSVRVCYVPWYWQLSVALFVCLLLLGGTLILLDGSLLQGRFDWVLIMARYLSPSPSSPSWDCDHGASVGGSDL